MIGQVTVRVLVLKVLKLHAHTRAHDGQTLGGTQCNAFAILSHFAQALKAEVNCTFLVKQYKLPWTHSNNFPLCSVM